jgi:hypothetical protein
VGATFIAFFLVKAAWPILSDVLRDNDYRVEREIASPGGTRRAVLYTGMGGGAAGWCAQYIAIVPSTDPFSPAKANEAMAYVFSGSCGSEITLDWAAENRLRVSYSIGDGVTLTKWPRTRDGAVTLEYRLIQ